MTPARLLFASAVALIAAMIPGSETPWGGLVAVLWYACCAGAGWAILAVIWPKSASNPDGDGEFSGFSQALLACAVGVGACMGLAGLSAWTLHCTWPAAIAFAALGVFGWRRRPWATSWSRGSAILLVACLLLGAWHQLLEGVYFRGNMVFADRWGDYRYHLHLANLIRTYGMPLVDPYNWPGTPFNPLGHRGVPLVCALIRDFGFVSAHDAGRILAIGAYGLFGGAAGELAMAVAPGRRARWVGAVCALVWAPLVSLANTVHALPRHPWPKIWKQLSAADPFYYLSPAGLASGAFHNFPQLVAMGLLTTGLLALTPWRANQSRRVWIAVGLFAVSGLLKPSAFVLVMPALWLVMATRREGLRSWLAATIPVAIAVLIYLLPRFVVDVPSYQGVGVDLSAWTVRKWLLEMGLAVGVVWVPGLIAAATTWAAVRGRVRWGAREVVLIAAAGSVLFATLFAEVDTKKVSHGNMMWGLAGLLPLCAPMAIRTGRDWCKKPGNTAKIAGWLLLAGAATHLLPGVLYAGRYPWVRQRTIPAGVARDAIDIAHKLPHTTRILTDPTLRISDLLPALDRRVVTRMAFSPPPRARWKAWCRLVFMGERERPLPLAGQGVLAVHDVVMVRASNPYLTRFLKSRGWKVDDALSNASVRLMRNPAPKL